MAKEFNTIDDFDLKNKTVLVRIDINSPVDPSTGIILDDMRMKLHSQTIKELSDKGAKVVILAHQSRPGKDDFTSLKQHAEEFSKTLNLKVGFADSIFSNSAKEKIKNLKPHDVLLLENVRFFSEEVISGNVKDLSESVLVKELSPLIDYYVNDAFAASHRSQISLIGFTLNTPSAAGKIMEEELSIIEGALSNVKKPCVFLLGGMKPEDSVEVIENVLKNETADIILTTGIVANIFLWAKGYDIQEINREFLASRGYESIVKKAEELLKIYEDKIIYPCDVAIEKDSERVDVCIENIPNYPIFDIGVKSIKKYVNIIRSAKTIFANGPSGVFEKPEFAIGTEDLIYAIAASEGFSIIGGGHIAAATASLGLNHKMNHVSSGGGACITLLSGKKLVAVEELKNSYKRN